MPAWEHDRHPVEFYKAESVVEDFDGRDQVIIRWFVRHRAQPVVLYEELIEHYNSIKDDPDLPGLSHQCEMSVDELFTGAEIEELRAYLASEAGWNLRVSRALRPGADIQCLGFYGNQPSVARDYGYAFLALPVIPSYSLSVPVWGRYDLRDAPDGLQPENLRAGLDFLTLMLQIESEWLQIPIMQEDLLERVYDELGLYVVQGKSERDRIAEAEGRYKGTGELLERLGWRAKIERARKGVGQVRREPPPWDEDVDELFEPF